MRQFKILLVYPNLMLVSLLPNNISLLAACLKETEVDVTVFDTTLFKTAEKTNDEMRVERMQVRKFDIKEAGLSLEKSDVYETFANKVVEEKPDLIAVSVVDDTVAMGLNLAKIAKSVSNVPIIFGGVHATLSPEELIAQKEVDIICIGEGEGALCELASRMREHESFDDIKNLWVKNANGEIVRNQIRPLADINSLPFEDFSVFQQQRLYRPMQGKMISMVPINFDRGCPYQCTFCDAPAILSLYRQNGHRYYRTKSIGRIYNEMKYQIEMHNVSYFYFNSETFLAMNLKELKEFEAMYSEFRLPFWCQTRVETVSEEKVEILKKMNCDRVSIGLEHGNENFRRKFLKKTFTNEQAIAALEIFAKYNIKVSVNNMLGFPDETRELVFDTINLCRKIKADSINGFVFQPYCGTYLRNYCIEKGYLNPNNIETDSPIGHSILNMPNMTKEEIEGLLRTFVLYIKMPEEYFPKIKLAEKNTHEGNVLLNELKEEFFNKYFK